MRSYFRVWVHRRDCLDMADSVNVVDDEFQKRIHSRAPSGHIHKGLASRHTLTQIHMLCGYIALHFAFLVRSILKAHDFSIFLAARQCLLYDYIADWTLAVRPVNKTTHTRTHMHTRPRTHTHQTTTTKLDKQVQFTTIWLPCDISRTTTSTFIFVQLLYMCTV